jgi:hypothetical protein
VSSGQQFITKAINDAGVFLIILTLGRAITGFNL